MEIRRTPPRYPRQGPSCLLVLAIMLALAAGVFAITNAEQVRNAILPAPTPTPTRSPASYAANAKLFERDRAYQEASAAYASALALDPTNVNYYIPLIRLLVRTGQLDEAIQRADEAVELAQDDDRVWSAKAAAHLAMGERLEDLGQADAAPGAYNQAVDAARYATQLNPTNAQAYAFEAGALSALGIEHYAEAQEAAEEAQVLDPTDPTIQYYYAVTLVNQGYYDAAREQLEVAIQAHPDYMDMYITLAQIYFFATDQRQSAILTLQDALDVDPNNAETYDLLAYFYLVAGQAPDAERNARQAVTLDPEMVRAHAHLGHAYYKGFNYPKAIEELEIAIQGYGEPTPNTAIYFAMLGLAYYFENAADCPKAIPYFNRTLAVAEPDSPAQISAQDGLDLCREYELSQPAP